MILRPKVMVESPTSRKSSPSHFIGVFDDLFVRVTFSIFIDFQWLS